MKKKAVTIITSAGHACGSDAITAFFIVDEL
jgi:hypothetical protein